MSDDAYFILPGELLSELYKQLEKLPYKDVGFLMESFKHLPDVTAYWSDIVKKQIFYNKYTHIIKSKYKNQSNFAKVLGVNVAMVNRFLNGTRSMPKDKTAVFFELLGE